MMKIHSTISSTRTFMSVYYKNVMKRIAEQMYNDSCPRVEYPEESISCPRDRYALSSFAAFQGSKLGASLGCEVAIVGGSDGSSEGRSLATLVGIDDATGVGLLDGWKEGNFVGVEECVSVGAVDGAEDG